MDWLHVHAGEAPLVVSIPHDGATRNVLKEVLYACLDFAASYKTDSRP